MFRNLNLVSKFYEQFYCLYPNLYIIVICEFIHK